MTVRKERLREIIAQSKDVPGALTPVLHKAVGIYGSLTMEVQRLVADEMELPLSRVSGVASFYSCFNNEVRGEGPCDFDPNNAVSAKGRQLLFKNADIVKPELVEEYVAGGGYRALERALAAPGEIIEIIGKAGMRGRSGAGFPVGIKWSMARNAPGEEKYIVCNASEGEPDTYKDLLLMYSNPHAIIEGMLICSAAVGAERGFIYVRHEYIQAMERLEKAVANAYSSGYLGKNILDTKHRFDIELRLGGGAYVCGEETALIEFLEGSRGEPRLKPPFPGVKGLWGKPTVINNVESFSCIPEILNIGPEGFRQYGPEKCPGTKLFTLSGCVKNPGVYELTMGVSVRRLFEEIGGGCPKGKKLKGFQIGGGASGAFAGADKLDTPLDIESCCEAKMTLGTGSLRFFDEDTRVIDLCKSCIEFFTEHSCGKCTPCRLGSRQMLELLTKLSEGKGTRAELERLEKLTEYVMRNSLCGLGQIAPTVVISALKGFRGEFEELIK